MTKVWTIQYGPESSRSVRWNEEEMISVNLKRKEGNGTEKSGKCFECMPVILLLSFEYHRCDYCT